MAYFGHYPALVAGLRVQLDEAKGQIARLTQERDVAREDADKVSAQAVALHAAYDEQASRIESQRDAEKARADAAEKRLADLRAWAVPMIPHYDLMDQVVARIDGKAQ